MAPRKGGVLARALPKAIFALFTGVAVVGSTRGAAATPVAIVPPHRVDTGDVPYPAGAHGDAAVTLVVVVDPNGHVTDVTIRDGQAPFAEVAAAGVKAWHF